MRENIYRGANKLYVQDLYDVHLQQGQGALQDFIVRWRELTFGVHTTPAKQIERMLDEVREMEDLAILCTVSRDEEQKAYTEKFKKEMADILIVMFCVAASVDFDLIAAVKDKMRINLTREWEVTGPGVGRHTKKSPYELGEEK